MKVRSTLVDFKDAIVFQESEGRESIRNKKEPLFFNAKTIEKYSRPTTWSNRWQKRERPIET